MSSTKKLEVRTALQKYMKRLASRRVVTADDAHAFLDRNGVRKTAVRERLSYINGALTSPTFESTGDVRPSTRPAARGRLISEWSLAE